jgi:putative ABC transport system permease protein
MTLVVNAGSSISGMPQALRTLVRTMDRDLPVSNLIPMEEILSRSVAVRRFNMVLLTVFACLGLILASIGIYGVTSYSVSQRAHEIGVRMALGAQIKDIITLVIRRGLILSSIGLGIGLVMALALARWIEPLLFKVSATDPGPYLIILMVLLAVTLAACYIPARRAARIDPMIVIRSE